MTDRATIDRLRGNASGRHKRNAAIADAARAIIDKWRTTGRVTQIDIAALAATIERTDRQAAPRDPESLVPYGPQNHPLPLMCAKRPENDSNEV